MPLSDQEILFDEAGQERTARGIDPYVIPVVVIMTVGFLFFLPKIFIANNIYLTSLEIERAKAALMVLQDENRQLRREVEARTFELKTP